MLPRRWRYVSVLYSDFAGLLLHTTSKCTASETDYSWLSPFRVWIPFHSLCKCRGNGRVPVSQSPKVEGFYFKFGLTRSMVSAWQYCDEYVCHGEYDLYLCIYHHIRSCVLGYAYGAGYVYRMLIPDCAVGSLAGFIIAVFVLAIDKSFGLFLSWPSLMGKYMLG